MFCFISSIVSGLDAGEPRESSAEGDEKMGVATGKPYESLRRHPRYPYHNVSLFQEARKRGRGGLAEVIMVGRGGAGIVTTSRLEAGTVIKFEMAVRLDVFFCLARVVYVNETADERYHVGLQFIDIDRENLDCLNQLLDRSERKRKDHFICADHPELAAYLN